MTFQDVAQKLELRKHLLIHRLKYTQNQITENYLLSVFANERSLIIHTKWQLRL